MIKFDDMDEVLLMGWGCLKRIWKKKKEKEKRENRKEKAKGQSRDLNTSGGAELIWHKSGALNSVGRGS